MNTIVFSKLSGQVLFEEDAKERERGGRPYVGVVEGPHHAEVLLPDSPSIKESLSLRNRRTGARQSGGKVRHKRQALQDMARPLKQWLYKHRDNPYPTKTEKILLALGSQMTLVQILRRADKNDDGKLSFDEFKAYFADGILSGEELHELFHTIDTHNTDNLDTEELCEYFSQHLGEYENVLSVLEDLNITILKAMDKTKKDGEPVQVAFPGVDYQEASNLEQFVTRFLLKETLNQLQSLQTSLECAMETTEEQTRQERQGPTKPEVLSVQWPGKRSARRLQRNNSLSPNSPHFNTGWTEEDSQWMTQINRLQKLIDRLEKKDLKLEPFEEEVLEENARSHIMIVQRQMSVVEEEIEEFRLALKQYVESASAQGGCLHVSIQKLPNDSRFIVYEFWENSNAWNSHLQTNYSKTFQRSNVDFLETPELITTMLVPASWWVLNNN